MYTHLIDSPDDERIAYLNSVLRQSFDLWIVHDEQGWHEMHSLDYFETAWQAFEYAFSYGVNLVSGL